MRRLFRFQLRRGAEEAVFAPLRTHCCSGSPKRAVSLADGLSVAQNAEDSMRALLHLQHRFIALGCLSLAACSDAGGGNGNGSGEGSSGFVEEDGGSDGSGSGDDASGSGDGSGTFVDTPVFLSVPPAAVEAGRRWAYEVRYAPAEAVTLRLLDGPSGATLEGDTLAWEVPDDGTVRASFTLALLREGEPSVEQAFDLRIGHAPAFGSSPATRANRGEDYLFAPEVSDADGDPVTLTLLAAPSWLTLGTDNRLTGQPDSSGALRSLNPF